MSLEQKKGFIDRDGAEFEVCMNMDREEKPMANPVMQYPRSPPRVEP